jgi:dienelactone hydrolase
MRIVVAILRVFTVSLVLLQSAHGQDLEKLKSYMEPSTPSGTGPYPTVMMVPGYGGFGPAGGHYEGVKEKLTKLGFLVIRVDSLRSRGLNKCRDGKVSMSDQVADIHAVADYLASQADVKKDAINLLGWSWGGGGTLAAAIAGEGINAAIAYYPSCGSVPSGAVTVPTLVLFGEADNVVWFRLCRKTFSASKDLTLRTYPRVHHAFDFLKYRRPKKYGIGTLAYNKPATKAAWREVVTFLQR